jgi:small GTP-binding protein
MQREIAGKNEVRNRAATLTPPGAAAIAVVRLSGPAVHSFLATHFSGPVAPNHCVHGILRDNQRVIDDPLVVLHTHGADINLHGGQWVVRECLELARRSGFEIIDDATRLPDSIDLIEQEMLAALPQARTEQAIRILLSQPHLWKQIRAQDVQAILQDRSLWWLLNPPRVAIVGIANVGKSTLANQLFGQQRSITANIPGTTRDWVGDWANLDGLPVMLLDTPGQRDSSDPIEQAAIRRSHSQIAKADLVIVVLDPTQPLADQQPLVDRYPNAVLIINKADLSASWTLAGDGPLYTAASTGDGIPQLRQAVLERFDCAELAVERPRWWTPRQLEFLQNIRSTS